MAHADAQNPELLRHYEGLIFRTAQLTAPLVEDDFDDICQVLRIKVWRALIAWDPARAPKLVAKHGVDIARDRSIFAWVKNQQMDIIKKKRRHEVSIEGLSLSETQAGFEHLASTPDEVYAQVEAELPVIPSTLTDMELRVVCLLYAEYSQSEVAASLGIPKREVERIVRSIRAKMADSDPAGIPPAIAVDDDYPETRIAA